MTDIAIVKNICKALDDKKAIDISVIDISGISVIADYFIVASANNVNHLSALQDEAGRILTQEGLKDIKIEGNRNSTWILMDCQDIIIHLFSKEDRLFYDLERIWKDGKKLDINELI